jgi:hypothetical protein
MPAIDRQKGSSMSTFSKLFSSLLAAVEHAASPLVTSIEDLFAHETGKQLVVAAVESEVASLFAHNDPAKIASEIGAVLLNPVIEKVIPVGLTVDIIEPLITEAIATHSTAAQQEAVVTILLDKLGFGPTTAPAVVAAPVAVEPVPTEPETPPVA